MYANRIYYFEFNIRYVGATDAPLRALEWKFALCMMKVGDHLGIGMLLAK
jgi:hypothetical protein